MTIQLRKIEVAINQTASLLEEAILKHENSKQYLEMEVAENKQLGNDDAANEHARAYVKKTEERVDWLRNHLQKLNDMKLSIIG